MLKLYQPVSKVNDYTFTVWSVGEGQWRFVVHSGPNAQKDHVGNSNVQFSGPC